MKKWIKVIILVVLNFGIIYLAFLIGKNLSILTNSQIECLVEDVVENSLVVSESQAMNFARNGEIQIVCATGCPIGRPTGFSFIDLTSGNTVLMKDNPEIENEMKNLGIRFLLK